MSYSLKAASTSSMQVSASMQALRAPRRSCVCLRRNIVVRAESDAVISPNATVQLGTAKLPKQVSKEAFLDGMYQWASTLTISGQNLPFALPLQADRTEDGFSIAFLRVNQGNVSRIARLECSISAEAQGEIFFIRFKAGDNPFPDGRVPAGKSDEEKLEALLDSMVDVPLIMNTMPNAIRQMVAASSSA